MNNEPVRYFTYSLIAIRMDDWNTHLPRQTTEIYIPRRSVEEIHKETACNQNFNDVSSLRSECQDMDCCESRRKYLEVEALLLKDRG